MLEILSFIADLIAVVGVGFSYYAWQKAKAIEAELEQERARQNQKITVQLQNGGQSIRLPVEFRRQEWTRAELLGRLGMIPMREKSKRFSLSYLGTPEFFKQMGNILEGEGDQLFTIPCNDEEFKQFDL